MTVDEALTSLRQMVDMGWIPNPEPVEILRRYVEEVREVEECARIAGKIQGGENCTDIAKDLAAARINTQEKKS